MGRMFVARILVEMSQPQPRPQPDAELAPIEPGAWAAWAKSFADETAPAVAPYPSVAPTPDPTAASPAQLTSPG